MSIGSRLKTLRTRSGQTLQQVADAVGASKPHIWELEAEKSKNPSLDLITKLAAHFQVPISDFLDEKPVSETMIFGREFKDVSDDDKKLFWDMAERILGKKSDG